MGFEHVLVERPGDFVTETMNWPERRNALSPQHIPAQHPGRYPPPGPAVTWTEATVLKMLRNPRPSAPGASDQTSDGSAAGRCGLMTTAVSA